MKLNGSITIADVLDGAAGKSINWLGELKTAPTNPQEYDAYYNKVEKKSFLYFNGIWQQFVQDGLDGSSYDVVFNKNRIVKYKEYDENFNYYDTIVTPQELEFYFVNRTEDEEIILEKNEYDFTLSFIETPKNGENITKNTFFSTFTTFQEEFNGIDSILSCFDNTYWTFNLKKLAQRSLISNKTQLGEEVYIVFHNSSESTNFDKNLSLLQIENGNPVYVGFYYPELILNNQTQQYEWEEKPDDFNQYIWYYYGEKTEALNQDLEIIVALKNKAFELYNISKTLLEKEIILFFEFFKRHSETSELICIKTFSIPCYWNTAEELATFSLKANSIVGAIDNSKLEFSSDGLTITNGGLLILNKQDNEEKLLEFDENGQLIIKGKIYASGGEFTGTVNATSGTFTGEVIATSGTFNGEIIATSGTFNGEVIAKSGAIENLIIGEENNSYLQLYVVNNDKEYYGGIRHVDISKELENSNFSIDLNGHIIAKSIELEQGTIGSISFGNSSINTSSWSLTPELAKFQNIVAEGKITTAIFEKRNIQLCGGSFLFKNGIFIKSFIITDNIMGNKYVIIEPNQEILENTLYLLTSSTILEGENNSTRDFIFCYCEQILDEEDSNIIIGTRINFIDPVFINQTYNLLVDLGPIQDNIIPDWIIGINSTNTVLNNGLEPNSITLSSIEQITQENGYSYQINPKIILGKIPPSILGKDTYGLYAESAYLSGTLTTQFESTGNVKYAGVNTLTGATFVKNRDGMGGVIEDTSKIIFWAGSDGTSDDKIQEAKFQVTENGTLYAMQGVFSGSIITDATIQASTIYTTEIVGNNDTFALTIRDTDKGIDFRDVNNNSALAITSDSVNLKMPLVFNEEATPSINIKNVVIFGKKIGLIGNNKSIIINPESLDFYDKRIEENNFLNSGHGNYYFNINDNNKSLNLSYHATTEDNIIIQYRKDEAVHTNCSLLANKDFSLGSLDNTHYTANYRPIMDTNNSTRMIGIDLYIEEFSF